jgi:hypothetical protein
MTSNRSQALRTFLTLGALTAGLASVGSFGCVASRDSRNGVFNENQYIRKEFLIRPAQDGAQDPGWMIRASMVKVSTPNPLGGFGLYTGVVTPGDYVRFRVTQDKLEMVSMMEISKPSFQKTEAVLESWPATNVDLKYRVNLDGETTNFYEENQEANWQDRQWLKFNPARNDMSDLNLFGISNDYIGLCVDIAGATVTLVPDTFKVDEANNFVSWNTRIVLPLKMTDTACASFFGGQGTLAQGSPAGGPAIHHPNVTVEMNYSMIRAELNPTYVPLEIAEKDPIRHKYGTLDSFTITRDPDTGLLASRQFATRHDPTKPIVWYFAPDVPERYKNVFLDPTVGVKDVTNQLLKDAGATAQLDFKEWNADGIERQFGDIRYHWIGYSPDFDNGAFYSGVTSSTIDPRTGQILSSMINIQDHNYKDSFVQVLDGYLRSIGASPDVNLKDPKTGDPMEWPDPGTCKDGDTMPISAKITEAQHNNDSLYQKMQLYMQKPAPTFGNLGPSDFIVQQDDDFYRAFFALMPYQIFADPDMNPYVVREGGNGVYGPAGVYKMMQAEAEFQDIAAKIDRGEIPYAGYTGTDGLKNASEFLTKMRTLTTNHRNLGFAKEAMIPHNTHMEPVDVLSIERAFQSIARHCVDGKWETKQEWVDNLIYSWERSVLWHEFGHAMGLDHNFMGSVDKANFPKYKDKEGREHIGLYSNSIMEYGNGPADTFFGSNTWAPYDVGALNFIYSNNGARPAVDPAKYDPTKAGISGQTDANTPWKDAKGFVGDKETSFLFCNANHLKYTPFCRQHDFGTTPSEIMAADINSYEMKYQWRNFRLYRKLWDNTNYASAAVSIFPEMRRFILAWEYDWSSGELGDTFRRIGLRNPDPKGSDLQYYTQLSNKFNADASTSAQMTAAFHKAIIQQSSGERPFRTVYDKYYGDVTQQGIILDKFFAMQSFVGMWPGDAYDPNQAGAYFASYSGIGDASYNYVAEDAVASMIGGQYDVYPYFVPLAVSQFAMDTHSPSFSGRIDVRDWIGGHVFYRQQDFLDYFRQIAIENGVAGCTSLKDCTYDPRVRGVSDDHNEFFGPDKKQWIWAYIPDRNTWVAVLKERNIASYIIVRNYTDYVVYQLDDGAFPGGAYGALLPMKYFLDSFNFYN